VSGSGKTTLVREILLPALEAQLRKGGRTAMVQKGGTKASDRMDAISNDEEDDESAAVVPLSRFALQGGEHVSQVVLVDQSALGKTPRSNPVVYIGAFDDVRELFAQTDVARQRGLNGSAFSFNSAVGQCERCRGAGFEKIEMQFLSDIFIRCPECDGRRYRGHILEVKLRAGAREWSVADMLEATVDDALEFLFNYINVPAGRRAFARLKLLQDVGLGYLRLGQPINTLSGGESQRLKLVSHLAEAEAHQSSGEAARREKQGGSRPAERPPSLSARTRAERDPAPSAWEPRTLFLFDEPTTGLHFEDVRVLLKVFQKLVDAGHSVVVIEHNLDVIKCADWVIDLGPDAGENGGRLVIAGTPEEVAACDASHTGHFLRELLDPTPGKRKVGKWEAASLTGGPRQSTASPDAPDIRVGMPLLEGPGSAITVHGAREHNLKNLSLEIPRGKFVVVTGVSGSGKSTLAFDLLFAEGQRRFLDSMNTYARQFVEQLARPDVDLITGLPPTVSIEQRTTRGGGKSTVATVTEVYHFFRLLFARLGTQFCPDCQIPVEGRTRDSLALGLKEEAKKRGDLLLLAPVVRNRKGFHTDVAEWAAKHGHVEIRADGKIYNTAQPFRLDRFKEHDVEIVVGVLDKKSMRSSRARLKRNVAGTVELVTAAEMIDAALELGKGTLFALDNHSKVTIHSTERACPKCARSFSPLDPKNFSYNSAQGWCPKCRGFGELFYLPEVERGANADAVEESWWSWANEREVCPECHGARLKPESRAVRLMGLQGARAGALNLAQPAIDDFSTLAVGTACEFFRKLTFKGRDAMIARDILPEIVERLNFLKEVGLGYVELGRAVPTLSGGEAQRIRLAAQLGSNLSGVLYVLDEPTIGLHARDNEQLLGALQQLQARGNSLVVVEHDEETMRRADYIIDLGPGAGVHGGTVVAAGTLPELLRHEDSITGRCLRDQAVKKYPTRGTRRTVEGKASKAGPSLIKPETHWLTLHDAATHNLKNVTVRFPLGRFVVVTGVSGSGKSTLVRDCLLPSIEAALKKKGRKARPDNRKGFSISGHETLKAVYEVDQSPIGRTPRSIPATYVGFFDDIRALFAQMPEARMRGYTASRFSFNSAQGRCPECEGAGLIKLEMNFLPPAFVRCETCGGSRFGRETLDIEFAGKNIAQVLDLSVEEAIGFFAAQQKILRPLQALHDTGLDYLRLGQTSPTLSGGEAQRVKLVTHLLSGLKPSLQGELLRDLRADDRPQANLFILEEPTIGLHMADVRRLVEVLQRLVDAGHSVIVIEHNLDFIAEADWVIDLGPEGGAAGGRLVAEGPPERVAQARDSHTGRFLRQMLKN
ncbi:MAG: excinuclease subunit, partial [Verrucomicrobiota bacterium]|jgi:excinuclease ABC subunit A